MCYAVVAEIKDKVSGELVEMTGLCFLDNEPVIGEIHYIYHSLENGTVLESSGGVKEVLYEK